MVTWELPLSLPRTTLPELELKASGVPALLPKQKKLLAAVIEPQALEPIKTLLLPEFNAEPA